MNRDNGENRSGKERLKAWAIVALITACILGYGLVVFRTVGDKGPPDWDFGAIDDVPGQSPYSTEPLK